MSLYGARSSQLIYAAVMSIRFLQKGLFYYSIQSSYCSIISFCHLLKTQNSPSDVVCHFCVAECPMLSAKVF
jgi:hypothetical protein